MPDIFDTVADEPKPDIFDQVSEGETISEARPSLLQRLRTSPLGRSILGPTDIEKQAMAGGVSGSQLGVAEIPEAMLKMTSIGLPPVRKAVESTQKFIEENPEATQLLSPGIGTALGGLAKSKLGRGVERGVEEFALDVPTAPLPGISRGKAALTALGVFGAQYLSDQPEVYQQFKIALQNGDVESATKIAVQNGLGALLLAFGAKHGINEIKAPLEREVQNASDITSPTRVPEPEVRSRMGQEAPLRQPGETAGTQERIDLSARQAAQAPQEAQVALPENIAQQRDALQAIQDAGMSTPEQDATLAQLKATETVNKAKQKTIADELKAQLQANAPKEAPVVEQPVKSAGEQIAPSPAETVKPTPEASVVPPEQSVTSSGAGVPKVARGIRARKIFQSETELGGPDILSWIDENMRMMSKSEAKRTLGKEWWQQNKSLYDDAAPLKRPHHNVIYGGKSRPDQVAQAAYEAGILRFPDVNDLWRAINSASSKRTGIFEQTKTEQKLLQAESDQHQKWLKAAQEGEQRVNADNLKVGDKMMVGDEQAEVTNVDPDGTVTIKDGTKFGVQKLESGQSIYVEKFDASPEEGGFEPEQPPSVPKLRAGEKGTGDLLQGEDQPFNLAGEKGIDAERLAREKLAREEAAKANELFQQQKTKDLFAAEPTVESVTPLEVQSGNVKPPPIPKPIGLGAAIPEEFKPAGATATSIKNATVDAERQQRGLPAMMGQAKRSFGTVWDTAMSVIDSDPGIQDRLIGELKNKPRSLTDLEDALLLHRRVDLRNEYAKATRDLAQAYDDGRQDAVTENMARVADWGDKLQELENVTKAGGRETARGLNARKMMANEDFTLAQMALDKRAAKGGGPLSQSETLEIQKIHDDYRKRIAELEQHLSERDQQLAELSSQQEFKDMQSEVRKETGRKRTEGTPESVSLKISEDAKSGDLGSLSTSIQKLARMFVEQGIKTRDALIDAVHDVVKDVLPNVTRREIMDAISGYGKFKQLTKDEISVQLRDLKGQMQQIGKLEDMASGVAPQKTGVERRTPSDEERRLIKQVEEAKRRGGYKVTDPATQLRTRLQAAKTAIQNQIKDLEFEIAKKERILKTKTEMVPDKELLDLRAKRDALKAEHKSIFGERVISEAQKLKMAESAIDRQISDLQDQLRTGEIFPPSKPEKPALTSAAIESKLQTLSELKLRRYYERQRIQPSVVPEIQEANRIAAQMKSVKTRLTNQIADLEHQIKTRQKIVREKRGIEYDAEAEKLRARRDELKKQFDEIFVRPEMTDAQRLQLWKNRTTNRIAELQAKLDAGDFTRKPKHPPVVLDNEAVKLQASVERLKKSWNEGLRKDELSRRNRWQKGLDAFVKWERAFKLSSPVVFGKLTAAAMTRLVTTGTEELVGGGLSQLPGLRRVAAQAPREGGLNVKAMAKGVTEGITKGMKDAWDTARTGGADIDVTFGDKIRDRDWANFFGQLHGMLKAPVKRAEFTLSLEKRIEHAINNGVDVTDPLVQTRLATEALNDGYRTIFMQHGFSSDMFNQFVSQMEGSKRYPVAGEIGARTMRFLLPIVRVPANIVAETATGVHGVPTASARVMFHVARGTLRELPPEIADSIMRQFKKGSIGLGLMAIGYFAPQFAGGYDWREKRKPGSAKTAGFQIYGWDVPRWMAHAPWFELMQIGATVRHVKEQHVAKTGTDKGVGEGLWAAGLGLIEETPFVGQMLRVDKLFGRPDERTSYLGELGRGTVVPQAIQWAAQQLDKNAQGEVVKRKPENLWQQFEMGIPGLRKNVPVKKDKTANPFAQ